MSAPSSSLPFTTVLVLSLSLVASVSLNFIQWRIRFNDKTQQTENKQNESKTIENNQQDKQQNNQITNKEKESSSSSSVVSSLTLAQKASNAALPSSRSTSLSSRSRDPLKMVLCVRTDLEMGKGKIAAQCAHAAVGMVGKIQEYWNLTHEKEENEQTENDSESDQSTDENEELCELPETVVNEWRKLLNRWEYEGAMKIALKVNSEEELNQLESVATALNLPNYLVIDAGRTQIKFGSKTVLAIGPYYASEIDQLTGKLKLM
jgi:PTH2 family peptidyl-tRNA hydrolase